jgi:hypothetical protein
MRRVAGCFLVLVAILAAPHLARAGGADEPSVVIRIKSVDTVLQNLKLIATLVGQEQAATDILGLINAKAGKKGLEGVDTNRPLGAYVKFGKELDDINGALLIPVADQAAFVTLLENLATKPTKRKDGNYSLQAKEVELFLRFANKYAYITHASENLSDKSILDPAKVLAGSKDSLVSATIRLDQIPDAGRLFIMAGIEQQFDELDEKAPKDESEAVKTFRKAAARQVVRTVSDVLKEGHRGRLDVNVDEAKRDLSVKLTLAAQPGTDLAKTIKNAGLGKSPFAGLMPQNAAFRGSIDLMFPEALHQNFAKMIEEASKKGLADITDAAKRKQAKALVDSILPTIRAGQLDGFLGLAGPVNDHYTLLAALKVKDGDQIGKVVYDLVAAEMKNMPAAQRDKIKLDLDLAGSVKIHRVELPPDPKTGKVLDGLTGDPNLHVAFRKDAVFLAIGPNALATIKQAVTSEQSGTAPVLLFDFNVARMAPTIAKTPEQQKVAKQMFPAGKDANIRVVVEGGDMLSLRINVSLDVLEFLAKMNEGKK